MVEYLGGEDIAGKKMKAKKGWDGTNGDNSSGFSALPSPIKKHRTAVGSSMSFFGGNQNGWWWSSTEEWFGNEPNNVDKSNFAIGMYLTSNSDSDEAFIYYYWKLDGLSVRCVKN